MDTLRVDPARFARLLDPRSIAVFGGAQAQEVIGQCDLMGYDGEIWPVHPKKDEVMGRLVYRSVDELPGSPDAAYVGVNRNLTIDIMRGLSALDAGGAISYATGFAEAGEEGSELTRQLLDACGDMVLVGPNCYGLLNYVSGAMLWPDQQGGKRVERGVAIITASSNVGFNITMQRRGCRSPTWSLSATASSSTCTRPSSSSPGRSGSRPSACIWRPCRTRRPSSRRWTWRASWASPSSPSRRAAPRWPSRWSCRTPHRWPARTSSWTPCWRAWVWRGSIRWRRWSRRSRCCMCWGR